MLMFHDELIAFRIRSDLASKVSEVAAEHPELFDSSSDVVRRGVVRTLREFGKLPKEQPMKSTEGKVMKDD